MKRHITLEATPVGTGDARFLVWAAFARQVEVHLLYKTPWRSALNFDGPHSDDVRRFFIENALYWLTDCHIDALRLDAVHVIVDHSA
jgi:1,4-alpha-glucan branching enzyme